MSQFETWKKNIDWLKVRLFVGRKNPIPWCRNIPCLKLLLFFVFLIQWIRLHAVKPNSSLSVLPPAFSKAKSNIKTLFLSIAFTPHLNHLIVV
jgi:hypothetical protein